MEKVLLVNNFAQFCCTAFIPGDTSGVLGHHDEAALAAPRHSLVGGEGKEDVEGLALHLVKLPVRQKLKYSGS